MVERGQLVTSTLRLAAELNLSRQSIRTCLNKLQTTGEITIKSTNKNTIVTICKYDDYQQIEKLNQPTKKKQSNNQTTNKQPTTNQQLTTTKEYKEKEESKELKENNTLTCVNTREKLFAQWLESNCPYIAKHYTLPTETEFEKLVNAYGAEMVADTCQQIENRADLRKRYTNLYRTLLNWLKKEKQSNMTDNEREREKRLASYAKVANEFLNTPIRECETIPFDVEH